MNWRKSGSNAGFALIPLQLACTSSIVTRPVKRVTTIRLEGSTKLVTHIHQKFCGAVYTNAISREQRFAKKIEHRIHSAGHSALIRTLGLARYGRTALA